MNQKEKIEEYAFYISYLFKKTKLAEEKYKKNNANYEKNYQSLQASFEGACTEFKTMCENYYHENLSSADYFRKVMKERQEKNAGIHERISR